MITRFFAVGTVLVLALTTAPVSWSGTTNWAQVHGPDHSGQMGPSGPMMAPLDQLTGDDFDRAFLAQMGLHHAMALAMSRPVVANAAHQEVKELAQSIMTLQAAEIQQMSDWAKAWYGMELPPMVGMMAQGNSEPMGMGGQGMPMDHSGGMMNGMDMPMMSSLWRLPPNRLEVVFLSQMIPHHEGAVEMAQLATERASHQELKDLARSIDAGQAAEVATMNGCLNAWYGL